MSEWNWKEYRKQKHQFRSYYCAGCRQRKPCGLLTNCVRDWQGYCCPCYFQREAEEAKEYADYQQVYQREAKEWQASIQQLKLLRDYPGCDKCGSKEVDGYDLLVNNKLVCRDCLIKKTGGRSSGALSWTEQQKWHQKHWGINISEWLDAYDCLPVNANCATKWLKDKQHLSNCACLELEAKELHELFTNSLREKEEKIKKCRCKASNKPRTPYYDYDNYGYTYCEKCEKRIKGAGKHGTIKNRNNPAFWGLNIPQKVLCGECLANYLKNMPTRKKYLFNEYVKRGYWK